MVQITFTSETCFAFGPVNLSVPLPRATFPTLVNCLANAYLQSPGQPDNRVSVQINHYYWALDEAEQWMSSVHARGGALVLMLSLNIDNPRTVLTSYQDK